MTDGPLLDTNTSGDEAWDCSSTGCQQIPSERPGAKQRRTACQAASSGKIEPKVGCLSDLHSGTLLIWLSLVSSTRVYNISFGSLGTCCKGGENSSLAWSQLYRLTYLLFTLFMVGDIGSSVSLGLLTKPQTCLSENTSENTPDGVDPTIIDIADRWRIWSGKNCHRSSFQSHQVPPSKLHFK